MTATSRNLPDQTFLRTGGPQHQYDLAHLVTLVIIQVKSSGVNERIWNAHQNLIQRL